MSTWETATALMEARHRPSWETPWHVRWGFGCVRQFATGTEADAFYANLRPEHLPEPPCVVLPRLTDDRRPALTQTSGGENEVGDLYGTTQTGGHNPAIPDPMAKAMAAAALTATALVERGFHLLPGRWVTEDGGETWRHEDEEKAP